MNGMNISQLFAMVHESCDTVYIIVAGTGECLFDWGYITDVPKDLLNKKVYKVRPIGVDGYLLIYVK